MYRNDTQSFFIILCYKFHVNVLIFVVVDVCCKI